MIKLIGLIVMIIGWVLLSKGKRGLIVSGIGIALLTI